MTDEHTTNEDEEHSSMTTTRRETLAAVGALPIAGVPGLLGGEEPDEGDANPGFDADKPGRSDDDRGDYTGEDLLADMTPAQRDVFVREGDLGPCPIEADVEVTVPDEVLAVVREAVEAGLYETLEVSLWNKTSWADVTWRDESGEVVADAE